MAKKTKAQLVEEGKELKKQLAAVRSKPHNFALLMSTDGLFLELSKVLDPSKLKLAAKKAGGGPKGAIGQAEVDGSLLKLTCAEGEDPPDKLGKLLKAHLRERGIQFKVAILSHDGKTLEADEEEAGEGAAAPAPAAPDTGIEAKLTKAFEKIKTMLVAALKAGPPDYAEKLKQQAGLYAAAMKGEDFEKALKDLTGLRKLIADAPSAERLTGALAGKGDPAKLAGMTGMVDNLIDRAGKDGAFDDTIKPQIKELRRAMKAAMAGTPTPEDRARIEAMKKKLDDVCLGHLAKEGHGPQRHEGGVTPKQLSDRVEKGLDPVTGTEFDAYKKIKKGAKKGQPAKHSCAEHATRLKDPGDYVDADETVRSGKAFAGERAKTVAAGSTFLKVEISLEDAFGPDYKDKLEGFTRLGTKDAPKGTEPTDFTGGKLVALYIIQPDGSENLLTMFPDPEPIKP